MDFQLNRRLGRHASSRQQQQGGPKGEIQVASGVQRVFWLPNDGLVLAIVKSRVPLMLGNTSQCQLCTRNGETGYLIQAPRPFSPTEIALLQEQSASWVQRFRPGWTLAQVQHYMDSQEMGPDIAKNPPQAKVGGTSSSKGVEQSPQPAPAPTAASQAAAIPRPQTSFQPARDSASILRSGTPALRPAGRPKQRGPNLYNPNVNR